MNITVPSEVSRLLKSSMAFFSTLTVSIGALGLLLGALSLANTVTASLFERIRDFGIKRALGATDLQLLAEVLRESVVVSLTGGSAGIGLALIIGWAIHGWVARGQQLFLFSPRLLAGAVVFSLILGAAAAVYSTLKIARVPPAEAIRRGA